MALKDWKKVYSGWGFYHRWINKKINKELHITRVHGENLWNVELANPVISEFSFLEFKKIKSFKSESQTLKFAKNYMRVH